MARLIERLVSAGVLHHQPSSCIFFAAARKRSATAAEIGLGIIKAENQAPGSDPAQRQSLAAQIILQHPIVPARPRVADGPDRRQIGDFDRQLRFPQSLVERLRPIIPNAVEIAINRARFRRLQVTQKFVHRRHDVRVRVESAAGKTDVCRAVVAKTLHQIAAAAHHADRQPAAERLAVGHDIGAHAEIFLRAAEARRKPTNTSSKIRTILRSVHTRRSSLSQAA